MDGVGCVHIDLSVGEVSFVAPSPDCRGFGGDVAVGVGGGAGDVPEGAVVDEGDSGDQTVELEAFREFLDGINPDDFKG